MVLIVGSLCRKMVARMQIHLIALKQHTAEHAFVRQRRDSRIYSLKGQIPMKIVGA